MKTLIFEWLNSGGLWFDAAAPSGNCPIQRQGCQMLNGVAADLVAGGVEVLALVDSRLSSVVAQRAGLLHHIVGPDENLPELLLRLAMDSDQVLVIAPEIDSTLSRCLEWLVPVEHKLLNPDAEFTALASNKSELFDYLKAANFLLAPAGVNFRKFLDQVDQTNDRSGWNSAFDLPAVLKPNDGAGSEEVSLITDWGDWEPSLSRSSDQYRLEAYVPGTSVSVSVLCGGDQCDVLVPTIQQFEEESNLNGQVSLGGHYVGAKFPIAEDISRRAVKLVVEVMEVLPPTRGYIGMDIIISDSNDPADDRLIEINPRLTMSYSSLAEIYGDTANWSSDLSDESKDSQNLAMRMVELAIKPTTDAPVTCTVREPCP